MPEPSPSIEARQQAATQFLETAGWPAARRQPLAGDASARRYDRVWAVDGQSAVLMDAPPNAAGHLDDFLRIGAYLRGVGLSAPRVLARDTAQGFLLLEDFGDGVFARIMADDASRTRALYARAIDVLLVLQPRRAPADLVELTPARLGQMLEPASTWYLPAAGGIAQDGAADLAGLFQSLMHNMMCEARCLTLRDYHAENLIWLPDRAGVAAVGLLDFQDAVLAHPAYDLVSILQDARRDVCGDIETAMIARFLSGQAFDTKDFQACYALLGVQRNLRILGIFVRLAQQMGKPQYLHLLPRVWGHIRRNLAHPALAPLAAIVHQIFPAPTVGMIERLRQECLTSPK